MSSIFKVFNERDDLREENLKLKNENRQLREIIDLKDIKICELNIKLIVTEKKLSEVRDWCDSI